LPGFGSEGVEEGKGVAFTGVFYGTMIDVIVIRGPVITGLFGVWL